MKLKNLFAMAFFLSIVSPWNLQASAAAAAAEHEVKRAQEDDITLEALCAKYAKIRTHSLNLKTLQHMIMEEFPAANYRLQLRKPNVNILANCRKSIESAWTNVWRFDIMNNEIMIATKSYNAQVHYNCYAFSWLLLKPEQPRTLIINSNHQRSLEKGIAVKNSAETIEVIITRDFLKEKLEKNISGFWSTLSEWCCCGSRKKKS